MVLEKLMDGGEMAVITDSVEVLVSKVSAAIKSIEGLSLKKDELWRRMQIAQDHDDRVGLVQTLAHARTIVRRQEEMKPAWKMWEQALKASKEFVQKENKLGHKGQFLFDLALRENFDKVHQEMIEGFPLGAEKVDTLIAVVNSLITITENYQWHGNFCVSCGNPIDKNHWKCPTCIAMKDHRSLVEESRSNRERQHEYMRPR